MGLGFQGYHGLDLLYVKHVRTVRICGVELFHLGAFDKGYIIFVGRYQCVGIGLRGFFD